MIKAVLTNDSLRYITEIEKNRYKVSEINLPRSAASRLRKNSKKKSSYASNRIEGNPLSEEQVDEVIDRDEHKHFLKPEQEVRNYFLALKITEAKRLIRESSLNFTQISESLGFSTIHYFSRLFKEKTGMTPTDYAEMIQRV